MLQDRRATPQGMMLQTRKAMPLGVLQAPEWGAGTALEQGIAVTAQQEQGIAATAQQEQVIAALKPRWGDAARQQGREVAARQQGREVESLWHWGVETLRRWGVETQPWTGQVRWQGDPRSDVVICVDDRTSGWRSELKASMVNPSSQEVSWLGSWVTTGADRKWSFMLHRLPAACHQPFSQHGVLLMG
eukprot:superscaffoldBa00004705_g19325